MVLLRLRVLVVSIAFGSTLLSMANVSGAWELLVSDRIANRILRYDGDGNFIDVLVDDQTNLDEPNGIVLSQDSTKLYVASRQNNQIVRYDYNGTSATNPLVITSNDFNVPASLLFSLDGSTLYASNIGPAFDGDTVARIDGDGNSAGAALTGGSPTGRTGLAFDPAGNLLVGSFQDGAVLKYDGSTLQPFIPGSLALAGSSYMLVHGNDLYVSGFGAAFDGNGVVQKFNATTGVLDAGFNVQLPFPAGLAVAPDGNGILVAVLGNFDGTGTILRYGFDGTPQGTFAANNGGNPALGFAEATGLLSVPEPSTLLLLSIGLAFWGFSVVRARQRSSLQRLPVST